MEAKAAEMPTMKAGIFTNYSDKDFVGVYGKVEYPMAKGASMMFEGHLALHFARQLAQRELNKKDILCSRSNVINEMKNALTPVAVKSEDETQIRNEVLNENSKKKEAPEAKKADVAEEVKEFAGLTEK